jgi:hypothetical protein
VVMYLRVRGFGFPFSMPFHHHCLKFLFIIQSCHLCISNTIDLYISLSVVSDRNTVIIGF